MTGAAWPLARHPASRGADVRAVSAAIEPDGAGGLRLQYLVVGATDRLRWNAAAGAGRADELWQHSCFEVFLRPHERDDYLEFNFAPSGAWAAYRFARRRTGRQAPEMRAPRIEFKRSQEGAEMSVQLAPAAVEMLAGAAGLLAGLAAVVEDDHGRLSYWALAHGGDQPDFHDPATFTVALPAR